MTQMKILNTSKKITLRDMYLEYEYKTRNVNSKTIPIPYFPKEEIVNHTYSLTFKQWKTILLIYFKHLILFLINTGKQYKIPCRLGVLQFKKYKSKTTADWKRTIEVYGTNKVKPLMYRNLHLQGYKPPILKWYRDNQQAALKYKWYWRFKLTKKAWLLMYNTLLQNLTLINKLEEL